MSHKFFERTVRFRAASVGLDILTDLLSWWIYLQDCRCILTYLVLVIPTYLIWKIRTKPVQKLIMGALLCLSICMVVAASIRVAGFRLDGDAIDMRLDMKWSHFWLYVEACIAVLTVSATTCRTIFTQSCQSPDSAENDDDRLNRPRARHWISKPFDPATINDESNGVLPLIPRATLTGMRTVIRAGPPRAHSEADTQGTDYFRLPMDQKKKQIRVTQELSSRSETVSWTVPISAGKRYFRSQAYGG